MTLYLTDRCNSRCISCDYWRHGRDNMTLESVERLLPDLRQLQTQVALLSGGEPLLNPDWQSIARMLRDNGQKPWLLTSALSLAKHARRGAEVFDAITVSLDGTDRESYRAIRGLDAFDKVCAGIRAAADNGLPAGVRVTLQRANYRRLLEFVSLAKELGARQVSFLAVDVANPHAFARTDDFAADLSLTPDDLPIFAERIASLQRDHAEDFRSGFIAESPQKIARLLQYFAAVRGQAQYPPTRCNAPEFSAVIGATGRVQPCFFIGGPSDAVLGSDGESAGADLSGVLNGDSMAALRTTIHSGKRAECKTCVCSMWRDPALIGNSALLMRVAS